MYGLQLMWTEYLHKICAYRIRDFTFYVFKYVQQNGAPGTLQLDTGQEFFNDKRLMIKRITFANV